jgi:hypothetical protein
MLGSTVHWLSLVNGFSGYVPPHVPALRAEVRALPDPEALQNLVDLSHVRWILLRPQADWPGRARTSMQDGLADSDLVGRSFSIEGFTLFEVDATARRSEWFAAIAAGPRPGRTALGTPIRELTPAEAVASVVLVDEPRVVRRKGRLELRLRVRNDGTADWPVLGNAPLHPLRSGAMTLAGVEAQMVYLEARWTPLGAAPARREPEVHGLHLIRDLPAGDSLVRKFSVPMPVTPGRYRLDVRVAQKQGRGFRAPPSRPLSQVIDVDRGTATRRSNRS